MVWIFFKWIFHWFLKSINIQSNQKNKRSSCTMCVHEKRIAIPFHRTGWPVGKYAYAWYCTAEYTSFFVCFDCLYYFGFIRLPNELNRNVFNGSLLFGGVYFNRKGGANHTNSSMILSTLRYQLCWTSNLGLSISLLLKLQFWRTAFIANKLFTIAPFNLHIKRYSVIQCNTFSCLTYLPITPSISILFTEISIWSSAKMQKCWDFRFTVTILSLFI